MRKAPPPMGRRDRPKHGINPLTAPDTGPEKRDALERVAFETTPKLQAILSADLQAVPGADAHDALEATIMCCGLIIAQASAVMARHAEPDASPDRRLESCMQDCEAYAKSRLVQFIAETMAKAQAEQ